MLGRVMGCLEQVFVHDSQGRPIYFETYAGHAPMGQYILSLFEKIEDSLEGAGPKLAVQRAIVMDAASNSVRTLRAFAGQKKYHYITKSGRQPVESAQNSQTRQAPALSTRFGDALGLRDRT